MTDQIVHLAAIQMRSSTDMAANLAQVETLVANAVAAGAQLIVLPENFASFGRKDIAAIAAAEVEASGPLRRFMSGLAQRHAVHLVGGTIPVASQQPPLAYAACFFYDDQGREIGRYNKIHLFDADVTDAQARYRESDTFLHGEHVSVVETRLGRIGLAVCYDLRFPELFQQLVDAGAQVIALPAAFTYVTGQKHWEVLLRARAIEQQVYLVAANQVGQHDGHRHTWGHSLIIDADGAVLADAGEDEGFVSGSVDRQQLEHLRRTMPVQQHKRLIPRAF